MKPYKPSANTAAARAIAALRGQPAGTRLGTREFSTLAGVPFKNFRNKMAAALSAGLLVYEPVHSRGALWSVGEGVQPPDTERPWRREPSMCAPREPDNQRQVQKQFAEHSMLVGKLRDLFNSGRDAVIGDPLQLLNDALDAAKAVDAAKDYPGCRFKSAEVDLLIARELRAISETAVRARTNLLQALEIMA